MSQSSPARSSAEATPPAAARQPTSWPVLILAMGLMIAPLIALSQFIAYWRVDVVDDQMFGYFGWRIAQGATVYLDVWDNKPPGIYWINAVGMLLGSGSYFGVIAMCVVALVVAHACFFVICASLYYRGAAAITTVLLSFFLTHGFYTGGTNRTETFLVPCELAAVLFYVRGFARDRWWKWYLAGVCCGGAILFKQVGLAACAAMALHTVILMAMRDMSVKDGLRRGALMLGGLVSTLALAAGYLAAQGALGAAWFAVVEFNRAYFATGESRFPYRHDRWFLLREHFFRVLRLPLLMTIAGGIHAVLWAVRPRFRPPEIEEPLRALRPVCPRYLLLFAIWFALAFWGALLSPHAFRHYLVPAIPPLLLLAGYLVNVLQAEMRLLVRLQQRAWVAAAAVAIGFFIWGAVWEQWAQFSGVWVYRFEQHRRAEWEVIGDAVLRVSEPQDKIQCIGYFPGVYLHARRINATRFTTTEKIGQVKGEAAFVMRELEEVLRREPPAVLVLKDDDYQWTHGRHPRRPPPDILLGPWIDENYERLAEIPAYETVYIYKRKDLVRPGDRRLQDEIPRLLKRGKGYTLSSKEPACRASL